MYLIDEGVPRSQDVEFSKKAGDPLAERLKTTTTIIISHDPEIFKKFAKKAAVLMSGQLHMFDSLEEAKQLYGY